MIDWLKSKIVEIVVMLIGFSIVGGGLYLTFFKEYKVDIRPNQVWTENTGNSFEDTLNKYVVLEVKDGWVKYYKKYPSLMLQNKITGETFLVKSKPIRKFVRDKKVIKNE